MPDSFANQRIPKGVVEEAIEQYPILKNIGIKSSYSYNPKQKVYGGLEFWPADETGTSDYPRPKEIPTGQIGVQIFNKDNVRPIDVLGDVASHHMIYNDPTMKQYYNQFLDSMTPAQKERLKGDYQHAVENQGEKRPFEQWAEISRLPGYFRGYTFDQWPEDFTSKVFTEDQIKLFDEVRSYLGLPAKKTSLYQKYLNIQKAGPGGKVE